MGAVWILANQLWFVIYIVLLKNFVIIEYVNTFAEMSTTDRPCEWIVSNNIFDNFYVYNSFSLVWLSKIVDYRNRWRQHFNTNYDKTNLAYHLKLLIYLLTL